VPGPKAAVGELARDLLSVALEAREAGRGTVVKSRADRLVEPAEENLNELRMLAMLIGAVGRTALGNEQLLVHWATRDEDFGVGEEELSAELRALSMTVRQPASAFTVATRRW
jgi:hypothetical protein